MKPRIHHTHPSGTKGSYSWQQPPSKQDIENSEFLRYVWGMRSRTLYVFDKTGVKATVPFSVYGK